MVKQGYKTPRSVGDTKLTKSVTVDEYKQLETLESFYQGQGDTKNKSNQMFNDFFARETPLKSLGGVGTFYRSVAEARKYTVVAECGK